MNNNRLTNLEIAALTTYYGRCVKKAWEGKLGQGSAVLVHAKCGEFRYRRKSPEYYVGRFVAFAEASPLIIDDKGDAKEILQVTTRCDSGRNENEKRDAHLHERIQGRCGELWKCARCFNFITPRLAITPAAVLGGISLAEVGTVSVEDIAQVVRRSFGTVELSIPEWIGYFGWHVVKSCVVPGKAYVHTVEQIWDSNSFEPGFGYTDVCAWEKIAYVYLGNDIWGAVRQTYEKRWRKKDDYEVAVLGILQAGDLPSGEFRAPTNEQCAVLLAATQ